jgi:Kef-type K+ transport system membrane component KefB
MISDRKIAVGIALATMVGAVTGLLLSISKIQPVLGGIILGVVIGIAVARGNFSLTKKRASEFLQAQNSKLRAEG